MQDVIYVLVMVAFVVVAALFVVGCDRIIGPDEEAMADHSRVQVTAGDEHRDAA